MERASYNTSRFSSLFGVRKTFNFLFIDFTSKAKLNNSSLCYLQGVEHIKSLKINIKALQMNHICRSYNEPYRSYRSSNFLH